ncbi:unnamed protein product [Camellia sinensis]
MLWRFPPQFYKHSNCQMIVLQTGLFRRSQGMYFSAKDKGEMMSMIYSWPGRQMVNKARYKNVFSVAMLFAVNNEYIHYKMSTRLEMKIGSALLLDMIVLTDGSRILGLGDLGVQGIGIPTGKLDMYVAAAGINPQRDLGLQQPCLEGKEYLSIVDEFMEAIHTCWPKAIVQFEDFQMKRAFERLQRYQKKGTAGVALAGLLGTVRAQDRPLTDVVNQKIVVVGAGSAGLGVFNMAAQTVSRMAGAEANPLFFLLDKDGLITMESKGVDPAAAPFAKAPGEIEGLGLRVGANLVKVKKVKPHVLLGLSGVGGVFNEQMALSTTMAECILFLSLVKLLSSLINKVLKAMRESDSPKPAIFAMSNPTMNAECTAVDAFNHAGENIVFASGSPFKNVDLGMGMEVGHVNQANQANNMYLFPGIKMGTLLSGAHLISDGMSQAASECYEEIQSGILYPPMRSIQDITAEVGAAIVRAVVAEELAEGRCDVGPKELREETVEYVKRNMWFPVYNPLVHEK